MTRCLRIFGAYSYRLTRKHSTVLLIALFILIITVILQMYAYRHQEHLHTQRRVGDFDYRPGLFLKGQQPNENKSYCEFNYGLPETLKWDFIRPNPAPELGIKSPYRVIYNAIKGTAFVNYSRIDAVTYATQATPEFIYHIIEIARYWDGPISLAVFVPDFDLDITMKIMNQLCHCYPGMSKVSLHLFYPRLYPPKLKNVNRFTLTSTELPSTTSNMSAAQILRKKLENYRNLDDKTRAEYIQRARKNKIKRMMMQMKLKQSVVPNLIFQDCSGFEFFDVPTFRRAHNMIYPINVGRNVARNASKTNYFIVSDIEMVPSDGLAPKFLTMVRKLMGDKKRDEGCVFLKTVFVVPLFEVERGEEIPRNKDVLVRMVAENRASYFHQKVCPHCQRFPGLQSWLMRPSPNIVEPMLIARREYPYHRWEPLYFGTQKEPWYTELLSWEGRQDKMVQMVELCLREYDFAVLDGVFLVHYRRQFTSRLNSIHDERFQMANSRQFTIISMMLRKKYEHFYRNNGFVVKCEMLELCLQEYRMVVLDGGFLCHAAAPRSGARHTGAERVNTQRCLKITAQLKNKYPDRPQCKVTWRC